MKYFENKNVTDVIRQNESMYRLTLQLPDKSMSNLKTAKRLRNF